MFSSCTQKLLSNFRASSLIRSRLLYFLIGHDWCQILTRTNKMQFQDTDNVELFNCNCQLRQTVQNLANKYRVVVIGSECGSSCDDRHETFRTSPRRPSTICGLAESTGHPRDGLHSPVGSEASSRLSTCARRGRRQSVVAAGGSTASNFLGSADTVCSAVVDECAATNTTSCGGPLSRHAASAFNAAAAAASAGEPMLLESPPARIVRIPNRMCPVHSRIDRQRLCGSGGGTLELNYDAISVSNCWQGLRLTSQSSPSHQSSAADTTLSGVRIRWPSTFSMVVRFAIMSVFILIVYLLARRMKIIKF